MSDWHYPRRPGPGAGRWQRFRTWLGTWRSRPAAFPHLTIHEVDTFSFSTPARGDGFAFTVDVRCDWCASGSPSEDELRHALEEQRKDIEEKVSTAVRTQARQVPAHRPEQVEAALSGLLQSCSNDGRVQCSVRVRVAPAPEIVTAQQALALDLLRVDGEYEHTAARIANLHRLRDLWAEFLRLGVQDWIAPRASHLAEVPHNVAPVLQNMLEERREEARRLLEETGTSVARLDRVDILDVVVGSETALRKTLELLGVPLPPLDPDSPFAGTAEGGTR